MEHMENAMRATANGIAHLSFAGGAVFLPVRTPYDRQMLAEYVSERVQAKGQVQILVDGQRWMVQRQRDPLFIACEGCGSSLMSTCYSVPDGQQVYCARCALNPARNRGGHGKREGQAA